MTLWLYTIPNLIIAGSYVVIPIALWMLMLLNPTIEHKWIGHLFIAFILACGGTHLLHVVGKGGPLSILIDWFCAIISVVTSVVMLLFAYRFHSWLIMVLPKRTELEPEA